MTHPIKPRTMQEKFIWFLCFVVTLSMLGYALNTESESRDPENCGAYSELVDGECVAR